MKWGLLAMAMLSGWQERRPMLRAQGGGAAALFGDTLVVAGGTAWEKDVKLWLRDVQVYDVKGDTWRAGPELEEPLAYGPFAQSGGEVEIFGGSTGAGNSRRVWRMGREMKPWSEAGRVPVDFLLGRAVRVGGRVFVFGGCDDVADLTRCSDAVWMREGGVWSEVARIPSGKTALAAGAVLEGQVYLFGGCHMPEAGKVVNRAEAWRFDPVTLMFSRLKDLPEAARGLTAVAAGGAVWIFGGYTTGFTAAVWKFDGRRYEAGAALPFANSQMEFFAHPAGLIGAGGEEKMRSRTARTLLAKLP